MDLKATDKACGPAERMLCAWGCGDEGRLTRSLTVGVREQSGHAQGLHGRLRIMQGSGSTSGFPGGLDHKESAGNEGDQVQSLGQEDPLEKGCGYPIPCLENPMVGGGGTWLPQANGVAKSQTRHN